jgi:hypothetical protein
VRNTSLATKLRDCRCEIVEVLNDHGEVARNIGLRTRGQEYQEKQGRFNLDQNSEKEIALFEMHSLAEPEPGFYIIAAERKNVKLDYGGIYTAIVRGYGDSGEPDETARSRPKRAAKISRKIVAGQQ